MRNTLFLLASAAAAALFVTGCAGPEQKLGRGFDNTFEVVRGGEMRRSVEQSALWDSPDQGYTEGAVHGFDRTLARTGLGLWEIVTFPIPNHKDSDYGPIATDYLQPQPVYPDSYRPRLMEDSTFETDSDVGFSSGDIAPMFPGSRFHVN
jgi:putative exosortase-associated protein (TIGR04073 family)